MSTTASSYTRGTLPMNYYRPPTTATAMQRPAATVTDDYERWYTEASPNNRMLLALRCGLDDEIGWALDRLCRLCNNEQFVLKAIPGMTDALLEWPNWFVDEDYDATDPSSTVCDNLFRPVSDRERKRRHAQESLFILRNAAFNEPNVHELAAHQGTRILITKALERISPVTDISTDFLLNAIDLLHAILPSIQFSSWPEAPTIIETLQQLGHETTNRALIISSLNALTGILSSQTRLSNPIIYSSALNTAVRYLPLFADNTLLDTCLEFLNAYTAHPSLLKAFLLHPDMLGVLRVLVSLLVADQVQERVNVDIGEPMHTVYPMKVYTTLHEIVGEELETLSAKSEPERCYEWMRTMFIPDPEGQLTQVEFWNLYKDTFSSHQEKHALLVASDVIKNVSIVFPHAQAMVIPGDPPRYTVKGVNRRKIEIPVERYKCHWDCSQCTAPPFQTAEELYRHITDHMSTLSEEFKSCLWANCQHSAPFRSALELHVRTHIPPTSYLSKDSAQPQKITVTAQTHGDLLVNPTQRPPPQPLQPILSYQKPTVDPSSTSLTALLVVRALFRASFTSSETAPRNDADHFGFPGVLEEQDAQEQDEVAVYKDSDQEGERRGRKAFLAVRNLMRDIQILDDILMTWITEMVDAGS